MERQFSAQLDAEKAVRDWFVSRNEARGQYPKRLNVRGKWQAAPADGTVFYTYTYKGETVTMIFGCYTTTVIFPY